MLRNKYLPFNVHVEGRGAEAEELDQRDSPVELVGTCGWLLDRYEDDSRGQ